MTLECLNPTRCISSDINALCSNCMSNLEDAAMENLANFGTPDYFVCGNCGQYYVTTTAYLNHSPRYCKDH